MANGTDELRFRPDGKVYSIYTRRLGAICKYVRKGTDYSISDLADNIESDELGPFMLEHLEKSINARRIRDYIQFLVATGLMVEHGDSVRFETEKPRNRRHWIQLMSDKARAYLAAQLECNPDKVGEVLDDKRRVAHRRRELPTIDTLAEIVGLEDSRRAERFRWAVNVYLDGDDPPLQLSRSPALSVES